jgi:thiamine biosynthesis lipoprotein
MGTAWWIAADREDLLPAAEDLVHALEARLTRFSPGSALARLNRERRSDDPLVRALLAEALRLRDATGGAFDPTLGRDLADLGYDRSFDAIGSPAPRPLAPAGERRVALDAAGVTLHGAFDVDLGGIAKGWAVDRVHDWLMAGGASRALVDGGGDLRAAGGGWPVGLEDGGAVDLADGAIATSSTRVRRWRGKDGATRHHVIDPRTRAPAASAVEVATVLAPTATLADVLATALIVDPAGVLPRLAGLGARAMIGDADGRWWVSDGWRAAA